MTLVKVGNREGLALLDTTFKKHMREKKVSEYFKDDMKYAFNALELKPYEESWLGYLITQNGYFNDNYTE